MASNREARLDAQFAQHTARKLLHLLRAKPRDDYFDSVARVLEAREAKATAVEAQLTFLVGVLRDKDADDEQAETSARLPTIEEEAAEPSEIHAARVAPEETATADLGIATLCSKCNQAPDPVQQRVVEESPKMVATETDLPFKKRKWAMVEDDVEIVPLQPIQQEGDLVRRSPVSLKRKADADNNDNEVVVGDDVAAPIQISKGPEEETMVVTGVALPSKRRTCDVVKDDDELLPLQPIKDSGLVQEEEVQEGDLADCSPVSPKRKADAVDHNEVGEKQQGPSDVQQWGPTYQSQSQLLVVSATESKGKALAVEEENSRPPVARLEEKGEKGEIALPSEEAQEEAEEPAHLVLEDEQEIIMEEEGSRVGACRRGDSMVADALSDMAQLEEQTSDRETVSTRGRGRGRGRGGKKKKQTKKKGAGESSRGRGRRTASSSEGCRCWLIAPESSPVTGEDGWLRRLTQGENSSEGTERDGSTTSALTALAGSSLVLTDASDTEWLQYIQIKSNPNGERDTSMEEEENAASALSVLASAALMVANASGTRNDGEGTSNEGGHGRAGNCTEGADTGNP